MRLHRALSAVICLAAVFLVFNGRAQADETYKRMVIREAVDRMDHHNWVSRTYMVSADGRHLGMLAEENGNRSFVLDGRHEPWFGHIDENTLVFGPTGSSHAYVAFLRNHQIVMLDGVPQKKYPKVVLDKPVFSPDASKVAYAAIDERGEFAVDGDMEGPVFERVETRQMLYDKDGRLFYAAKDGKEMVVMMGGEEFYRAKFIAGLMATEDGSHTAFAAGDGSSWRLVIDGRPEPKSYEFIEADNMTLKPDGTPVYVVAAGGRRLVVDGTAEGPPYRVIIKDTLKVSPDGNLVAYGVVEEDGQRIIVGEIRGSSFEKVGPPVFSPDGKRFAYTAGNGTDWYVVVDGNTEGPFMGVSMKSLVFSPDSKHFAFSARVKKLKWAVFLNGSEYYLSDGVSGAPVFGPWSRRIAFVCIDNPLQFVVINGDFSERYDSVVTWGGGRVVFGDEGEVRYFAVNKRIIYYVEEWPEP